MDNNTAQLEQNDFLLEVLVSNCNRGNGTMSITFSSKGLMFSATIISGRRFWQAAGDLYAASFLESDNNPENAKKSKTVFNDIADKLYGEQTEETITYVHFTDLVVLSPQFTSFNFTQSFPYWRFKLSSIDGWAFGSVNPDETE